MEHYEEVIVALSDSILTNCLKRPLAAKSRGRDILLVIKARNHASQIKSYFGSLSGSSDRLVIFIKKQQISMQKTYQFINVVKGVSHSHNTANICFFHLTQSHSLLTEMFI